MQRVSDNADDLDPRTLLSDQADRCPIGLSFAQCSRVIR